jgi:hypothetical protein
MKWKGNDGFGYEYIFKLTQDSTAPDLPLSSPNEDDYVPTSEGWTDDPGGVSASYPFCWVAWRKKEDGVWSAWMGTSNNKGRLYSHYGTSGTNGDNGYNTATVYLYTRRETQPTISWPESITYTFATGALSFVPTNWYKSIGDIPAASNEYPLWVTAATATSREATHSIAYNEWATPVLLAANGTNGTNGTNGLNTATIFLYHRAQTAPAAFSTTPNTNLTYTFATGELTGNMGNWSRTIPATDGNPCYYIHATAIASTATDTILPSEWSTPTKFIEDGTDGISPIFPYVGEYSSLGTYYGNHERTDIVYYNGVYYRANPDAPTGGTGYFSDQTPSSSSLYWIPFGANFQNIATGLLLAEEANIANFIFRNQTLVSTAEDSDDNPLLVLDGLNGEITAKSGSIGPLEIGSGNDGAFLQAEYTGYATAQSSTYNLSNELLINEKTLSVSGDSIKSDDDSKYASGEFNVGLKQTGGGFVEINCDQTVTTGGGIPHYDCGLKVAATGSANALEVVGNAFVNGTLAGRVSVITSDTNVSGYSSGSSVTLQYKNSGGVIYMSPYHVLALTLNSGIFSYPGFHIKVINASGSDITINSSQTTIWEAPLSSVSGFGQLSTTTTVPSSVKSFELIYLGMALNGGQGTTRYPKIILSEG